MIIGQIGVSNRILIFILNSKIYFYGFLNEYKKEIRMVKISALNNIKSNSVNNTQINFKSKTNVVSTPIKKAAKIAAAGMLAGEVSTFLKDFNKTSTDGDNYFQLKINSETGKPFEADTFQKAAAMNLYLGNDVLVTAPTGTGKTAIAEYIITKNFIEGKRTFYTTPLKALSNEKYRDFCKVYGKDNVGILTGDTKVNIDAPIIIMTTEVYRNMTASEHFNLDNPDKQMLKDNLQTVIFDELQYLGDVDRGGVWEQSIMFTPKDVQILSLSATIGNNEDINNWIASTKGRKGISVTPNKNYLPNQSYEKETVLINVPSENRHVPLSFYTENVVPEIKLPRGRSKKEFIQAKKKGAQMATSIYAKPAPESYKELTHKLNKTGKLPAIYFIFSKKDCRKLLQYLADEGDELTTKDERFEISKILKQYKDDGIYLGESLNIDALYKGYAVHNAGLLPSQKQLIEELFQKKLVKVVLATETLSAGINMPAKTTVISSPRKPSSTSDGGPDHKRNLTPNEFHQMAGRAGRRGIDTEGFCHVLSCNNIQKNFYETLISQPSNPLYSNIDVDYAFIANYTSEYLNEQMLRNTLSKSLYVNNKQGSINENKLNDLMKKYRVRHDIMEKENYIDKNGHLTIKGELIKSLNGYEQIPIINLISDKSLTTLDAVEIASIIGGLANIEYDTKDDNREEKEFYYPKAGVNLDYYEVVKKTFYDVKDYEKRSSALYPDRTLNINGDVMSHIYQWADMNSYFENSRMNWRKLYSGDLRKSIRDEGSLFKEITGTIDLMKQLTKIAAKGEEYAEKESDKEYYRKLGEKLKEGISLLQREPVTDDNV